MRRNNIHFFNLKNCGKPFARFQISALHNFFTIKIASEKAN